MNELKEYTEKMFEDIKHIDENGNEYWYARELMKVLEYKEWRKFNKVIQKAMEACNGSNYYILDHFVLEDKMVSIGSNTKRNIKDYKLSRYMCYLIVQNADPSKEVVALGQSYFAIQTRKQEITEQEHDLLTEDEKRFYQRRLTKQKLLRDKVQGENNAKNVHYEVGKKVRQAIADIGGMMPEEMPTPKKSLKELEREKKQEIRKVKYT